MILQCFIDVEKRNNGGVKMSTNLNQERIQNFLDATSFKEPKKIPIGAEILSYPFAYAGVTYESVMDDPVKTAEIYSQLFDDIKLDFLFGGAITYPVKALQTLGIKDHVISNDGICIQHQQANLEFMSVEDYDDLINDTDTFISEIYLRKRTPVFNLPKEEAYEKLKESIKLFKTYFEANELIGQEIYGKRQILPLFGPDVFYYSPLNVLFDNLRGIKDTLIDLRRRPKIVREAVEAIWKWQMKDFSLKPEDCKAFPLAWTVYHSECFLSPKQFDEFFFDRFKKTYGPFMEAGIKFFLKGEGSFINTLDRYRQLPKGSMVMMLDEDDPFEVYEEIGDWATIATGITVDLLQCGTKQQCIDYVKKCFDTFAPGGGFIFMQNKPLLCANDVKKENLIAVYETANELSSK